MSSKPVVLVYFNTWEPFLFIIKTIAFASKRDVQKFINPSLDAEPTLLTLVEPLIATSIVAEKTTLVKLTADERETYKLLYQAYKDNNLRISTQLKALSKIQDYIINNISRINRLFTKCQYPSRNTLLLPIELRNTKSRNAMQSLNRITNRNLLSNS